MELIYRILIISVFLGAVFIIEGIIEKNFPNDRNKEKRWSMRNTFKYVSPLFAAYAIEDIVGFNDGVTISTYIDIGIALLYFLFLYFDVAGTNDYAKNHNNEH